MGIIYEPKKGKWWIEARTKSVIIHDCGKREIELDNEEFNDFQKTIARAKKLRRTNLCPQMK
jgi:hypothetical protein